MQMSEVCYRPIVGADEASLAFNIDNMHGGFGCKGQALFELHMFPAPVRQSREAFQEVRQQEHPTYNQDQDQHHPQKHPSKGGAGGHGYLGWRDRVGRGD